MTNAVTIIEKEEPLEDFYERLTDGKVPLGQFMMRLEKEAGVDFGDLPKVATIVWNGLKVKQAGRWFNNVLSFVVAVFQNENEWRVYTVGMALPDDATQEMKDEAKKQKEPPPPTRYTLPKLATTVNYAAESMPWPTLFGELTDEMREVANNTAICAEIQRQCPSCGHVDTESEFVLVDGEDEAEEGTEGAPTPPNGAGGGPEVTP